MTAVNHYCWQQSVFIELFLSISNIFRVIIDFSGSAPQNYMHIRIAAGLNNGSPPFTVYAEETVRTRGRDDGVDGDGDVAVGAVLEANRRRQARRNLAVRLRFGGAGANSGPTDQVSVVLRCNRVQCLGGCGHSCRNLQLRLSNL